MALAVLVIVLVALTSLVLALAAASPATVVTLPPGTAPAPLLVVIPDRGEAPEHAATRWRAHALDRGWGVLAMTAGSAREVLDAVAALDRQRSLDATRLYLVGSGDGAVFVGQNAPRWRSTFAAIVLDHGGAPPPGRAECPAGSLPAYFLGAGTPATAALRRYYARCELASAWDRGGTIDPGAVLAWLAEQVRPLLVATR